MQHHYSWLLAPAGTGKSVRPGAAIPFNRLVSRLCPLGLAIRYRAQLRLGQPHQTIPKSRAFCWALWVLLASSSVSLSQPLRITSLSPARNAHSVLVNSPVVLTLNMELINSGATLDGLRVFSQQRGNKLGNGTVGTTSVSGTTLSFVPGSTFKPGETVYVTSTTAIQGQTGSTQARMIRSQVYGFTMGVWGTGQANFVAPALNPDPPVDSSPTSVVVGDVDGDGDLDLVTANQGDFTIGVKRNEGGGSFTQPATVAKLPIAQAPISLALGDVDGDGDLDLLATIFPSTVLVRLNDGQGNFTGQRPSPSVGRETQGLVVGDVDGDGDLDLLTANTFSNNVSVRLNDGQGNFTPPAINPNPTVGQFPTSVALGDVDGDGDLDLLTTNQAVNTISLRLNDGQGNFTPPTTNGEQAVDDEPTSLALGDVDGDGDLDLVTANEGSNTVSVRLNDGQGNFTPPATNADPAVGLFPISVTLGDADGDGDLDLLTANANSNTVSLRLNDGQGKFTPPTTNGELAVSESPNSLALGDLDGDGDLDLVTANRLGNNVSLRLNNPTGVTNPTEPTTGQLSLLAPDYDCRTGAITFRTTGGTGSPIEFRAAGITDWTSNPIQLVDWELRQAADAQPITLLARQDGKTVRYIWDIRAVCPVGDAAQLRLIAPLYDCESGAFTFQTTGGTGSPIEFRAAGITDWTSNPIQLVDRELRQAADAQPMTLLARQDGKTVRYVWDIRAFCPLQLSSRARVSASREPGTDLQAKVYPNPIDSELYIQIRNAQDQAVELQLLNLNGQPVLTRSLLPVDPTHEERLSVGHLPSGSYLLQIHTARQQQSLKVIKR